MKKNLKFELADNNKTLELEFYIDKVVDALGHKNALVTDESYVSDFLTCNFRNDLRIVQIRVKELAKAYKKLKIDISEDDLVIDVAKRLRDARK